MEPGANDRRALGGTDALVTSVAMGCWPIAGITSLDVNDDDSLAALRAALDAGINFFDTAYCYGVQGESERLIRRALGSRRREIVLATKGGVHFNADGKQGADARPDTLIRECDESLERLGTDCVDLYYLHAPDPAVAIEESAGAVARLIEQGKTRFAGASNCTLEELSRFHQVCPLTAVQLPYNMLQRDIERKTIPWCQAHGIALTVYWSLMKGLLAGRISDATPLDPRDSRRGYPMYQGSEWEKNLCFVDRLRGIAERRGCTVAQLVVNWTLSQPGVTSVLCGAKRAWQIEETARAMGWRLSAEELRSIELAIAERGQAAAKRLFQ